jgi:misacylated tRNA(Ala) deacylase
VRQDVDFARRWDHMQQHTGQHLLSAIMDSLELPTLSWSMGAAGEMNYIEIPRKPSDEEMKSIQDRCNEAIRDNIAITIETPEEVDGAKKLPGDYDREKGVVRFIKIGDLDYNACCGTHLKQTSHIGLILLHHMQTVRGTNCRLYFSAGDRAINLATESVNAIRNIAVSLSSSSGASDVKTTVQRLSDAYADSKKKEKKMLAEIAHYEGERIKSVLLSGKSAWCYRATDGLDFINLVVFEVRDAVKERGVIVFASGEVQNAGSIMILGEDDLVECIATKAKGIVSTLKGGGKGGKWQGKVTAWKKGEIEALKVAVEDL